MAQHIGCQIEDEQGNLVKDSGLNYAPIDELLWGIDPKKEKYTWLTTIDQYGDTVFNNLQVPILISELEKLKMETDQDTQKEINNFIEFFKIIGNHTYIRFVGD